MVEMIPVVLHIDDFRHAELPLPRRKALRDRPAVRDIAPGGEAVVIVGNGEFDSANETFGGVVRGENHRRSKLPLIQDVFLYLVVSIQPNVQILGDVLLHPAIKVVVTLALHRRIIQLQEWIDAVCRIVEFGYVSRLNEFERRRRKVSTVAGVKCRFLRQFVYEIYART